MTAPATVSGEVKEDMPLATLWETGKAFRNQRPAKSGDLPDALPGNHAQDTGLTEGDMTTRTVSVSFAASQRKSIGLVCVFLGALFVWGVGFAQSSHLHNAAHDTRHAIGFPCH